MIAPSGEQIAIAVGDQQAVIVEVGGGLRSYSASGLDLVDGYGADEMSSSGRGQVLIPWPNRLEGGSYEFDGKHHQLPLNEPERRNAIHGLVRWAAWNVAEREAHRVVMQHVLHPRDTSRCAKPRRPQVRMASGCERDRIVFRNAIAAVASMAALAPASSSQAGSRRTC